MRPFQQIKLTFRKFIMWHHNESSKELSRSKHPKPYLTNAEFCLRVDDVKKLIVAAETSRDALIIQLLAETGMRRSEVVHLRWEDIDFKSGQLIIRKGKGGKMRIIPITFELLSRFINLGFKKTGFVFTSRQSHSLSARQLNRIVRQTGELAGIKHPNPNQLYITCHLFRHTFARLWKNEGASVESLSKILGHSSIKTTWDVYGKEAFNDVQRNYNSTIKKVFHKREKGQNHAQETSTHTYCNSDSSNYCY